MKSDELTIKTLVSEFSDNQIREAMESIDGNSPLDYMIELVDIMSDYIVNNEKISGDVKNNVSLIYGIYLFYLKLLNKAIGE